MITRTKPHEITSTDIKAVRDFLIGLTDEVRIEAKPTRPSHHARPAVPVTHGISRDRIRSAKPGG